MTPSAASRCSTSAVPSVDPSSTQTSSMSRGTRQTRWMEASTVAASL